jgi:hypothetical protein
VVIIVAIDERTLVGQALLEWANDPDAGPMGDAVTAALALLEIRPLP